MPIHLAHKHPLMNMERGEGSFVDLGQVGRSGGQYSCLTIIMKIVTAAYAKNGIASTQNVVNNKLLHIHQ
jgi:hypothetical protein